MSALADIHRCFRCGYCKYTGSSPNINCPPYLKYRFESYSQGGRLWLVRAWLEGRVAWSSRLAEILYSCSTCRSCVEQCPFKFRDRLVDMVVEARREAIERGLAPPKVRDFLENLYKYGNPWGLAREKRGAWAEGVKRYEGGDEYLLHVGCVASYEECAQRMAKSLAALLGEAGVSFGILGESEVCDGNEAYMLGEEGLFQALAEANAKLFSELGVRKVIALSPHAYNAFKNLYPKVGVHVEAIHYTQMLLKLVEEGSLKPHRLEVKATYHDPCFLGRFNGVYDEPRAVLESIPGLKLIEMERSKREALCCGGGSGNFYTDFLGGPNSPARVRVREAHATGAKLLVVACPICLIMLEDAVKAEDLDGELRVVDVAELLLEACRGG
ncbi:Fe-S oxidoreductase [Candidatus Geothermarchaeota archaeon ex4572_27]|nr:MAG: Fe-S oxidoreductase [Candidatus Geothermarchaeota archaeon ex4572_27]